MRNRQGWTIALAAIAVGAMAVSTPAMAGKFKKIVDTNTPIPDGGGAMFAFVDDATPAVGGDWVSFGSTSSGSTTIWRARKNGTKLLKLFTPTTQWPGLGTIFANWRPQLDSDTVVAYSNAGIFTMSTSGRRLRKLVSWQDTSNVFPGDDKRFAFGQFFDLRVRDGVVVFSNRKHVFSVPLAGGTITPIAGSQSAGSSPPEPYCCLFTEPSLKDGKVFVRSGSGSASYSPYAMTSVSNGGTFDFVATADTHPPKTPSGHKFQDTTFSWPVIDQSFVFGAGSAGPTFPNLVKGIYSRGERFVRLVDDQMEVPGGGGATFAFGQGIGPIVADNGIVVFFARGNTGDVYGLYVVSPTGGRVRKIIARGDSINGFTVDGLAIGRDALGANPLGGTTVVFRVWYAGGGSGMYSIDLALP